MAGDLESPVTSSKEGVFIDSGADSSVYQFGNEVVKVYKEEGIHRIQFYQKITNQTAERFQAQPRVYQIEIGGKIYNYTISVNPIKYVGENSRFPGKVTSVSKYIPGPRLADPFPPEVPFGNQDFSDPVSIQLETLSDQLNEHLGVKGILILEPNVKFRYAPEQSEISLTVTDISSHIWDLEPVNPSSAKVNVQG